MRNRIEIVLRDVCQVAVRLFFIQRRGKMIRGTAIVERPRYLVAASRVALTDDYPAFIGLRAVDDKSRLLRQHKQILVARHKQVGLAAFCQVQ